MISSPLNKQILKCPFANFLVCFPLSLMHFFKKGPLGNFFSSLALLFMIPPLLLQEKPNLVGEAESSFF